MYYRNTEANESGILFLDNNIYIRNTTTSTDLVNDVFSTPGDVLVGGTQYQDQSIYAQASGDSYYAPPTFGTSTRNLTITDSAGNTIFNSTTAYTTYNINTNFTLTGGRTYYVRGRTDFAWPTSATLTINGFFNNSGYYYFAYDLSTGVEGTITINAFSIISDAYYTSDCSGFPDEYVQSNSDATIPKGQYGIGYVSTGFPYTGYASQKVRNEVQINGSTYSNGSTFTLGATTVTVSINRFCQSV
jgi:hypothetical protein